MLENSWNSVCELFTISINALHWFTELRFRKKNKIKANERPFKIEGKCFFSHLKSSWFLRYLNFCPNFFCHLQLWLISKFMTSSTSKKIIAIHILPKILRSKDNQTMKFGQLIEGNIRNIFLQESCAENKSSVSSICFFLKYLR